MTAGRPLTSDQQSAATHTRQDKGKGRSSSSNTRGQGSDGSRSDDGDEDNGDDGDSDDNEDRAVLHTHPVKTTPVRVSAWIAVGHVTQVLLTWSLMKDCSEQGAPAAGHHHGPLEQLP